MILNILLLQQTAIDLSGAETAYFLDYEDYYENGTRNVVLQILDRSVNDRYVS